MNFYLQLLFKIGFKANKIKNIDIWHIIYKGLIIYFWIDYI